MLRLSLTICLALALGACGGEEKARDSQKTSSDKLRPPLVLPAWDKSSFQDKKEFLKVEKPKERAETEICPRSLNQEAASSEKPQQLVAASSREELAKADQILSYHNKVQATLAKGGLADDIYLRSRLYQDVFTLPKKPPQGARHNGLLPPAGLFNEREAKTITDAFQRMDKALAAMLSHYDALLKYMRDPAIKDDGKAGKILSEKIAASHGDYVEASRAWLSIVDAKAAQAEDALLDDHPLRKQIMAARGIFSQFRQVASLTGKDKIVKEDLAACRSLIQNYLDSGSKPPFNASPGLERLYRAFLQNVRSYLDVFDRAEEEGFHDAQREELNMAMSACRKAYNDFAKEVNANS